MVVNYFSCVVCTYGIILLENWFDLKLRKYLLGFSPSFNHWTLLSFFFLYKEYDIVLPLIFIFSQVSTVGFDQVSLFNYWQELTYWIWIICSDIIFIIKFGVNHRIKITIYKTFFIIKLIVKFRITIIWAIHILKKNV